MNGWIGKLLRVNLASGDINIEDLDPVLAEKFVGCRGLGVKFLYDEIDPRMEPLSEANKLVFMTGPLTGTGAPSADGCFIVTKSPLSETLATGRVGGEFGPELKYAGYDGVIIEGKAASPVMLWIEDDKVELKPAGHLWGKTSNETEDAIRADIPDKWKAADIHLVCIGPAGERLARVSSIVSNKHHVAARSGMGAVMGFKNLKAIVVRGTKDIPIANGEAFQKAIWAMTDRIESSVVLSEHLRNYGKVNVQFQANARGAIAVRNFRECTFEGVARTNARLIRANHLRRGIACFSCPVACVRLTEVKDPEFAGKGGGPEFQSDTMLGADCGVDNLSAILKANFLCNEYGMDTISVGGTIACAMDMYESGYLTEEQVGGELKFGNAKALVEMVEKMGKREGFGNELAEGGYRLAAKYGHPEMFMGVKKQELPAWNARVLQGAGLEFATANNAACHTKGGVFNYEVWGIPVKLDPNTTEKKAFYTIEAQHHAAARDTSGICSLLTLTKIEDVHADLMTAATGITYTPEDFTVLGERMWNLERLFNIRAGFTAKDDTLPDRMLKEPMPKGSLCEGRIQRLPEMLPEYYQLRGWDENGVPTAEKLAELGLP